jgi:hypothetical protein
VSGPQYVVGIPLLSPGSGPYSSGRARNRAVSVVHGVAMPVGDNPVESICGLLVIATVDVGWHEVWGATRCETCLRLIG